MKKIHAVALLALVLSVGLVAPVFAKGKMVGYIAPKNSTNPPPTMPLNAFQRFEIKPIAMDTPYAGQKGNEVAKDHLQANIDQDAQPVLAEWNAQAVTGPTRTLRIEPAIRHIKFVGGGTRFFAGGFAGGSAVLVTVKFSDAETGEVIAEPEFYQHANGVAGAWTFGSTDKAMLIRVAQMITDYLKTNYNAAVGGPTSVAPGAKS